MTTDISALPAALTAPSFVFKGVTGGQTQVQVASTHLPWRGIDPMPGEATLNAIGACMWRRASAGALRFDKKSAFASARVEIRSAAYALYGHRHTPVLSPGFDAADELSAWFYSFAAVALNGPSRTFKARVDVTPAHRPTSKYRTAGELVAKRLRSSFGTHKPFAMGVVRLAGEDACEVRGIVSARHLADGEVAAALERAFPVKGVEVFFDDVPRIESDIRQLNRMRMTASDAGRLTGIVANPKVLGLARELYEQDLVELGRLQRARRRQKNAQIVSDVRH
ncbi:hypothetical protein FHP25_08745 [Vineibacter terrae]|uniref:Uncharacterized protein n=1 Tax=Vineibacter terrae TaxID=2586908 RepID=A0A5C8PRE6_9HYPH|nr:hypothetical protein [Vineibacter terrae]TXL78266.1 hypothetical protein FHP25_08745 [Vineibacter terrae]